MFLSHDPLTAVINPVFLSHDYSHDPLTAVINPVFLSHDYSHDPLTAVINPVFLLHDYSHDPLTAVINPVFLSHDYSHDPLTAVINPVFLSHDYTHIVWWSVNLSSSAVPVGDESLLESRRQVSTFEIAFLHLVTLEKALVTIATFPVCDELAALVLG